MAAINKEYLDYDGLALYDTNIKQVITDVEEKVPAISVDTVNETLVIDFTSNED